jgi:hypothetical protein
MSARKIGSMIVTDGEGRPIGIFTLKDLMNRVVLSGVPVEVKISQVMTPDRSRCLEAPSRSRRRWPWRNPGFGTSASSRTDALSA